jgi:flagellar motor switch protein FliN/FliY
MERKELHSSVAVQTKQTGNQRSQKMDNQANTRVAREFATAFAGSLSASLALATGSPWPLEVMKGPDVPTSKGTPMHFRLKVDGALSGECFVEFFEPQVIALVSKIAKQPIVAISEEHGEALAKVISSALVDFTESLASSFGTVSVKVDRVAGLAFGGMFVVPLAATDDPSGLPVLLYFGVQLLDALSSKAQTQSGDEPEETKVFPYNLRLVMDVELNVSVLFGQRQLPLRDVLALASGSVVELDRMVDEPVELLLDGKLIARGEAVIVDGNYGLRVTEIPQPVVSHFFN